jgi:hypothetical protein
MLHQATILQHYTYPFHPSLPPSPNRPKPSTPIPYLVHGQLGHGRHHLVRGRADLGLELVDRLRQIESGRTTLGGLGAKRIAVKVKIGGRSGWSVDKTGGQEIYIKDVTNNHGPGERT